MTAPDGRTLHYGEFYGVTRVQDRDDRRTLVVWGNCQAEALRIVLASAGDLPYRTVRVPPVHELTAEDIPHVERLLDGADVVASQPVRPAYRRLPIGTADIMAMARASTKKIVWPVIRYGGLFPFQVIVRHPDRPAAVPTGVPYHDLRTILSARQGRTRFENWDVDVSAEQIRSAAIWSIAELARRESRDCDVGISDILSSQGADAAHTINHPGNGVLMRLGGRVLDAVGGSEPTRPDRELLGTVRTPLENRVVDALELDAAERPTWTLDGDTLTQREIYATQMLWYAEHPEFIDAAITRYGELLDILGIAS
ncbi:WcbI family polysaccharide biosynthesis putative acetyltransferase [Rhodococcoides yunnanense]|uniref:WcbI family polysaccharide biosynthesis putative acetyltransferase n=1 Tax=Rhodococcoides yunnanense TaxID=278209 RepID=UPI000933E386|nr:WcbI family polysaccharide biosynthesis putative acetyltransferase [Rhodococcus yunnanensis]